MLRIIYTDLYQGADLLFKKIKITANNFFILFSKS